MHDASQTVLSKTTRFATIFCLCFLPASWYQGPFTKSLQRAEALFRNRFNPSLKWFMGQKNKDGSWDSESESIASCSSRNVQRVGQALQSLSSQCHTLRDPASGGRLLGCVTGLSSSEEEEDFYHHPQAAVFSQHYCQLQQLMEQRAQLLFLHEYARRTCAATCFVAQLGSVSERTRLLLADRGQPNSTWNLGLGSLCREMQVHVNHWDLLWSKARADRRLCRALFGRAETLASMRRTLHLLGFQALRLMERCIHTALSALAAAQPDRVPRDALVDLLCAVELYNQILDDKRSSQLRPPMASSVLQTGAGPTTFPVEQLMTILAQSQARKAAEQLYTWSSQQTNLLHMASKPKRLLSSPTINIHAVPLEAAEESRTPLWSSNLPFSSFISRDRECLDTLFQVLVTSTNLLAPHVPKIPADLEDSMVVCRRASEGEDRHLNRPRMTCRTLNVATMDLRRSDACVKLFCRYKVLLWREFGKAVVRRFYYQPHSSALGSVNQWNDEMLQLLVSWLRHSYVEGTDERMGLMVESCNEMAGSYFTSKSKEINHTQS